LMRGGLALARGPQRRLPDIRRRQVPNDASRAPMARQFLAAQPSYCANRDFPPISI
jgi:hypothetical protein